MRVSGFDSRPFAGIAEIHGQRAFGKHRISAGQGFVPGINIFVWVGKVVEEFYGRNSRVVAGNVFLVKRYFKIAPVVRFHYRIAGLDDKHGQNIFAVFYVVQFSQSRSRLSDVAGFVFFREYLDIFRKFAPILRRLAYSGR